MRPDILDAWKSLPRAPRTRGALPLARGLPLPGSRAPRGALQPNLSFYYCFSSTRPPRGGRARFSARNSGGGPRRRGAEALPRPVHPVVKDRRGVLQPLGKSKEAGAAVGAHGLGPWTSSLSETRSNQLSYAPGLPPPGPGAPRTRDSAMRHAWPGLRLERRGLFPSKGGDPAAGSPTATLLRLHPSHRSQLGRLPPLRVGTAASGGADFHDVTGGVYKARERIQGAVADVPLLAIPTSCSRVADCSPNWGRLWGSAPPRGVASHCTGHCSTFAAPGVGAIRT